ncbi:cupin domain-containing protein [Pedobacter sp.]|uniref:cupin domain-containing protein n=1 Tax=Pedobacter sp. TaxID=1411316 RepID=UPI003BA85F79
MNDGTFLFKIGEAILTATSGDTIFGPKGVPHSFSKTSEGIAKLTITFQPAGRMEEFFIAVSQGKLKNTTDSEQQAFRKAHGFESVSAGVGIQKKF